MSNWTYSPVGALALPQPGDIILTHASGLLSSAIRLGERIRFRSGSRWSHAAFCYGRHLLIEAVAPRVKCSGLGKYRDTEYIIIHTGLVGMDLGQAQAFALSCVGQEYGFLTYAGLVLRMGLRLPIAISGTHTKICSVLAAQTQVRGWKIFSMDPVCITPAELAEEYGVPDRPEAARA